MKIRSLIVLAAALAAGPACLPVSTVLVKVEMPGVSPFPAGLFNEIVLTDFRDDSPLPGLELGRELPAYLAAELARSFKGKVSRADIPGDAEQARNDPGFWIRAGVGRDAAVFLTGSASLVGQVRKALDKEHRVVDGPFNIALRGLLERRRWTLTVDLSVISATTGELLYEKTFREEQDYLELDKPADFAFSALAGRLRIRLLPVLLGASTIEERTLLRRRAARTAKPDKTNSFPPPAGHRPGLVLGSFMGLLTAPRRAFFAPRRAFADTCPGNRFSPKKKLELTPPKCYACQASPGPFDPPGEDFPQMWKYLWKC